MIKKIFSLILILGLFFLPACDDGFEELNQNPLDPSDVSYGALFNDIIESLRLGWNRQLFVHNEILYDVTEQGVVTAQTFGNVVGGVEDIWSNYYTALKNANELYRRFDSYTEDPEIANVLRAQLKIIMAYKSFAMVELFGDIPYSEAGRAFDDPPIFRPKYDDQVEIYLSLLTDLEEGSLALANAGMTSMGNSPLRYGISETLLADDLSRWISFSNSLELRYLVRIYDKMPDLVNDRVKTLLETGANFIGPGADVVMSPRDQSWSNLGVNWSFREHNKLRLGSTMWNYMTEANDILDPRLHIFFEPNVDDEWVPFPQLPNPNTIQSGGEPYNKDARDASFENKGAGNIYSSFNFYLVRDEKDIPEILMTAAEVSFLRAEIDLRGIGTPPDASNASFKYDAGMTASLNFWQDLMIESEAWINKAEIQEFLDFFNLTQHPKYALNSATAESEKLRRIYAQRWIDAFRQPWEAFALLRRTNMLPREKGPNEFYRFQYPPSESAVNGENYAEQVAKMGGDNTDIKLWWMQ